MVLGMRQGTSATLLVLVALSAAGAERPLPLRRERNEHAVAAEDRQNVPAIRRSDLLVVEGTLAGCLAAWEGARAGRSVVLAASGASVPHDIIIALRPWAREEELARLPKEFAEAFRKCVKQRSDDGELVFDLAKLAIATEDLLLDAGVRLLYGLAPCGVAKAGDTAIGAVFAAKGGLVALRAKLVVDCTADARLAALAGAPLAERPAAADGRLEVRYTMLAGGPLPRELVVKGVPELAGDRLIAHGSFAEFPMRLATRGEGAFREAELTLRSRIVAANAGRALGGLVFARGGDALMVQPSRRIIGRSRAENAGQGRPAHTACQPQGVEGILVCGPAADVSDDTAAALAEPFGAADLAALVARAPLGGETPGEPQLILAAKRGPAAEQATGALARFGIAEAIGAAEGELPLARQELPIIAETDVLVVGGGTSGVPAAIVAAHNGAKTLLVEKHSDLGGTHTLGGVTKYWFGRPTDFVRQLDRDALALLSGTGMPKSLALLYAVVASGASVVPQCQAVGALLEGDTVKGAVVATPAGLAAITAKVVIDATGDGDVAAWAGASHDWGTGRDALTLWFSFGHFVGPKGEASRQYHSAVDMRDPADFTRAIITARRRGGIFGRGNFPQYYLAPRESRRIRGRAPVPSGGILAGQRWPDTVAVAEANFDIKGIASSDLALCGYAEKEFTKNYPAHIPFRALLPEGLEGIIVVGKAYSVSHDALSLARMQRDLMALGGAAGLAAAKAVAAGRNVADVDLADLQKGLIRLGILRPADLAEPAAAASEGELARLVRELAADTLPLAGQVRVLGHGEAAVPLLRNALPAATERGRLACAKALCFLGERAGVPILLAELERQLGGEKLPPSPRQRHEAPDHGYAPEPAFLIRIVGRARDPRLVPLLRPLAQRIPLNPRRADDAFEYVFAIAYACERMALPEAIEALEILADKPGIKGSALPAGADPRRSLDHVAERHAYLELCVGRALARCGATRGYEILIGYLGDIRGTLSRSARMELADLAGRDLGPAPEPWRLWLAKAPRPLPPKPYLRRLE